MSTIIYTMAEENGAGTGQEQQESERVQLEIPQIARSTERVLPAENISNADNTVVRVGKDTSLVINKGDTALQIFTEQGRQVEAVDMPEGSTDLIIVDWEQLPPPFSGGEWQLVRDERDIPLRAKNYKTPESLPEELRPAAMKLLNVQPDESVSIPSKAWKIDTSDPSKIAVDVDRDHIMIYQPGTDSFIAYRTKAEDGSDLEPRNWVRVDTQNGDASQLNKRFLDRIKFGTEEGAKSVTYTNNKAIVVTESGLTMRDEAGNTSFTDSLPDIKNNVTEGPRTTNDIYYCGESARSIYRIDTDNPGGRPDILSLPEEYHGIQNLKMDSSGLILTFTSQGKFVMLQKGPSSFEPVGEIPNLYHGALDEKDVIRGIDVAGHLVTYRPDFQPLVVDLRAKEVAAAAEKAREALDPDVIATKRAAELEAKFGHLKAQRDSLAENIKQRVGSITDLDTFQGEMNRVNQLIQTMGLQPDEQEYMRPALENIVKAREQEVVRSVFSADLTALSEIVREQIDMNSYTKAGELMGNLNALRGKVTDEALREQLKELDEQFQEKQKGFKTEINTRIREATQDIVQRAQAVIAGITSKSNLAVWSEEELSQYKSELGNLKAMSIPENQGVIDQANNAILRAIKERRDAIIEMEASTGTTESDLREIQINNYKDEIRGMLEAMNDQGFQNRGQITTYLDGSNRYAELRDEVDALLRSDPQAGREIRRELGVSLALYIAEIERSIRSNADGDGRPMVMLGEVPFPVWQERTKPKRETEKHVELTFIRDTDSSPIREGGRTITLGEVGVATRNGKPDVTLSRVYQGKANEDELRSGLVEYRGEYLPGTTVTSEEFKEVKKAYQDWQKGERSDIKQQLQKRNEAVHDYFLEQPVQFKGTVVTLREAKAQIKSMKEAGEEIPLIDVQNNKGGTIRKMYIPAESDEHDDWENSYNQRMQEYAEYVAENHVLLLERIDELRKAPDTEEESSLGYVPEWKSHWTIDKQTSDYLGKIAKDATMQLELQQGIINLEGHAGTGKDVLVKMFCHETKRPYFAFDCSKWTVESDLAEDITLENGSVVKIPSAVLQAIETPGAVLYFNEINAMPEPTQIFLHSLLDEKRTLTLKTSGGKSVKSLPSVLFMSSMNPNYPGTFDPQFATKSRMDYLPIDYPPLEDPARPGKFSSAEALRIARGIDSLEEHTYDLDLDHNDFVKIWDKHINGIANDAPDISNEQLFDLKTVQALVQFTDKLRTAFKNKFNPTRAGRNELKVSQPMTGRELAKCAYDLSMMDDDQKAGAGADPVAKAKELIEQRLFTKISNAEELENVTNELRSWNISTHP